MRCNHVTNVSRGVVSGSYLSLSKLKGYLKPGGNKGGGSVLVDGAGEILSDFVEFPAFPDLTMPFLGGIRKRYFGLSIASGILCFVIT